MSAHRLPQQRTQRSKPPSLTLPAEGREPEKKRNEQKSAPFTLTLSLPRSGARGQESRHRHSRGCMLFARSMG